MAKLLIHMYTVYQVNEQDCYIFVPTKSYINYLFVFSLQIQFCTLLCFWHSWHSSNGMVSINLKSHCNKLNTVLSINKINNAHSLTKTNQKTATEEEISYRVRTIFPVY